jgi:hypothetical protein
MSAIIKDTGHAFSIAAHTIVKSASLIQNKVLPAIQDNRQAIEAITNLISPQAVGIERLAFLLLGNAASVVNNKGNNIQMDIELINEIQSILPALKNMAPIVASGASNK